MKQYKIGVFGSAAGEEIEKATAVAKEVGEELGVSGSILITGACSGLPNVAAVAAAKKGAEIWGFSPAMNYEEQVETTKPDDNSIYNKIIYVPENFPFASDLKVRRKYRNVISTATCDAGIIIAGRWGTMHEFCSLYDFGKVIGVLAGTGGIADELPELSKKISKESRAKVIFNDSPKELVNLVIKELETR